MNSIRKPIILLACMMAWTQLAVAQVATQTSPATAPVATSTSAPASQPRPFVMATYNINYGCTDAKSLESIVELIKKSDADVVAIQEITDASAGYFRKTLSKLYPNMIFQAGPAAGGLGILSRTAVQKTYLPPAPGAGGWFGTLIAKTRVGGKAVIVASVHLRPTTPNNNKESVGPITERFMQTEEIRAREIKYILAEIAKLNKAGDAVFLLGDFNSPSMYSAPTILGSGGFIDSAKSIDAKADNRPSWHWTWQGTPYSLRLDYIFHQKNTRTLKCNTFEGGPSDHRLVVSELQWSEVPGGPTTKAVASQPGGAAVPKTLAEALGSPESMAAGLRSGMLKKDFKEQAVRWRLLVSEITQRDGAPLLKAQSASGFAITCRMPMAAADSVAKLKADDWIDVEGKISDFKYEKPQESGDIFQANIEMLGVLLDGTSVKKVQAVK